MLYNECVYLYTKTLVKPRIIIEKLRRRHAVSYAYALEDRINLSKKERDIYVITGRTIIFFVTKNFSYAQKKINNNKKSVSRNTYAGSISQKFCATT